MTDLGIGATGDEVETINRQLRADGFLSTPAGQLAVPPEKKAATGDSQFDRRTLAALIRFQEFYGLPRTGRVDRATRNILARPRCGRPSHFPGLIRSSINLSGSWNSRALRYAVINNPAGITMAETEQTIEAAFDLWAAVTPLRFTQVGQGTPRDIELEFAAGAHGDNAPFDGTGGTPNVLAHAWPPDTAGALAGDVHFDNAETWSAADPTPTGSVDLLQVAAHEIGHALGLEHTSNASDLMFPTHHNPTMRHLSANDINAIQALYGNGFTLQVSTPIHETDHRVQFTLGPDGDLFAIAKQGTSTGKTEVHILTAASRYQAFAIQKATDLHETDANYHFIAASNRDLVVIKRNGTTKTEFHRLTATSGYTQYSLQTDTALHPTDDSFEFLLADNDDLFVISRKGTSSTEAHILTAASGYKSYSRQAGTALAPTDSTFDFALGPNRDIYVFKKQGAVRTEVHILEAASDYQGYTLQTRTPLHATDHNYAIGALKSGNLAIVKKRHTGTGKTEVHILDLQ